MLTIELPVQAFLAAIATPLACIGLGGYLPKLAVVTLLPLVLMLMTPLLSFGSAATSNYPHYVLAQYSTSRPFCFESRA
jgi:hypothetical protein